MFSYVWSRKVVLSAFVAITLCVVVLMMVNLRREIHQLLSRKAATRNIVNTFAVEKVQRGKYGESVGTNTRNVQRKDVVNNNGASEYLTLYDTTFRSSNDTKVVAPNPNKTDTITTWWQAAAMIDWYIHSPIRYSCKNKVSMGNWHICQDEPYTVKPPCLVYSFGISWDFRFDDAMAKLGCEVHSFDPSMKTDDHKRGDNSTFHNLGIGSSNTDGFIPRLDSYVKERVVWKMRTVDAIMKQLGHENRVIDVFKMDVEGYEWGILDNMQETGVLKHIRQLALEYHLFRDLPLFEEYVYIYKTATRLREMGFREFRAAPFIRKLDVKKFRLQGDLEFINAFFDKQQT